MNGAGAPAPTFIKAVEYWVPNADRSVLEFGSGLYGPGSRMALISKAMCLGRGEGLPGLAWPGSRTHRSSCPTWARVRASCAATAP